MDHGANYAYWKSLTKSCETPPFVDPIFMTPSEEYAYRKQLAARSLSRMWADEEWIAMGKTPNNGHTYYTQNTLQDINRLNRSTAGKQSCYNPANGCWTIFN